MNREAILALARKCGMHPLPDGGYIKQLEAFYRSARNAALEEAARICSDKAAKLYDHAKPPYLDCAAAIRERMTK